MARQPEGPPPPPTVQKLRLRYAKRGPLRFASHRDLARALERALRRAQVPMAFSAGFSPHPKISYVGAAPTGSASEAEYAEIGLTRRCEPEAVRAALDASLPPGIDVLECVEALGPGSLADRIDAAVWRVELPGVAPAELAAAVEAFLAAEVVTVAKRTKNGLRDVDARPAVADASAGGESGCAILHMVVRQVTPSVRPDDVLAALVAVADLRPPSPPRAVREAQGRLDGSGTVADPLGPDRVAGARCQGEPAAV
ncbi:TIGR03936 family radical SAM-associated protein [Geodermatophilus sp. DSM 44513]|uniref:TIGR03936 family radical SAM-associated protein n=1 Tax=Geodermatophilus sp. DSM 44513 TaxID=1528104 RepID=UPI00126F1564|nr:TIGR03936 family radical SAM-associated protein [Geodermatophilus sp. DSM 44513]WNV76943.1 TIGR03936 family radical SAM-associated protein [Geodermatophilus sp. DSM 44513]